MNVTMPLLHPGQHDVYRHPARFKVLANGRRWGKTRLGMTLCLEYGLHGRRAWWVAPSYKMAQVGWDGLKQLAKQVPGVDIREGDNLITFPGGGVVQVRSADNPDSLRGQGLDYVVMDECAFMKEEAWQEAIRPALSDRKGGALFISTPKGRNWFYRLYQRGINGDDASWQSWRFMTTDNPYIDPDEVEAARAELPDTIFRQEYMAEFIEDAGLVFRNVRNCVTALPAEYDHAQSYVMGVDWAQSNDFTVLTVMDDKQRVVAIDRFNQIDWATQRMRLKTLAAKWHVRAILAEENSIGGPNIEQLQHEGLPVQAFTTTNTSKQDLMTALQLAFERGDIAIPDDPTLIAELEAFEAVRLPSGKWRYEAPTGMHDDMVMSLALSYEAQNRGVRVLFEL